MPRKHVVVGMPVRRASSPSRKRKAAAALAESSWSRSKKAKTKAKPSAHAAVNASEEKRLRRFRPEPPQSFHEIYARARTQRFYVLARERITTISHEECNGEELEEKFTLTGSTGNVYTVIVGRRPRCDCPHAAKGNQCKHVLYVLSRVLRARFDLVYQLALLRSEVEEILGGAPPMESAKGHDVIEVDGKRKPVEGDCAICFHELLDPSGPKQTLVWCKSACGQNLHKQCFRTWAATKKQSGEVTCPICRSVWEGEGEEAMARDIVITGLRNEDGYVNVAGQLGINTTRDYSSYHGYSWVYWGRGKRRLR